MLESSRNQRNSAGVWDNERAEKTDFCAGVNDPMKLILPLLLLGSILIRPAFADVRVVAPTGAPYTEIQAAVDAANDGDVILVRAGTYASFVVRNQSLVIAADTTGVVQVQGAIRVSGVGATRTLLLSGLKATGALSGSSSTKHGLIARNCDGPLRVVGCELFARSLGGSPGLCNDGQGAWVENCADVVFVGCDLRGSSATTGVVSQDMADGGHGAYASASNLALYESSLRGGKAEWIDGYVMGCDPLPNGGSLVNGYGWGEAGQGLRAEGCFVFGSHATIIGGGGRESLCVTGVGCFSCATPGGAALVNDNGTGNALLLDTALTPGVGGISTPLCSAGIVGFACAHCCPSHVSCTAPSGPPLIGLSTTLAGASRGLTSSRAAREGQLVTLTYRGQPGDRVELLTNDRTTFHVDFATRGVRVVKRARPEPIRIVGTIGAGGTLTETWTIPDLGAGVQARSLYMQALMTDTSGQATLSSPVAIVLLDASY